MAHIQFENTVCTASDGAIVVPEFSAIVSHEIVGLVGRNGCGKSTLLRAVAGDIMPSSGSILLDGTVALMRQESFGDQTKVAQALGVDSGLRILQRFEEGIPVDADFENVDWSLAERIDDVFVSLGLFGIDLDRAINSFSGGERNRLKLAAILLKKPDILLLDEPTNDLDAGGREAVFSLLEQWKGPALVASHDRELLEKMDRVIELTSVGSFSVMGGWSQFVAARDAKRAQAAAELDRTKAYVKSAQRAQQARVERQEQRSRQGKNSAYRRNASKLEVNAQKERAQSTTARNSGLGEDRIADASSAAEKAQADVARVTPIEIALPKCGLASNRTVIKAESITCEQADTSLFEPVDLTIIGPERVLIDGRNGIGKSSLLRVLAGQAEQSAGLMRTECHSSAFLDQHLDLLSQSELAIDAMHRHAPGLSAEGAREALAKFGFRAKAGERVVANMSGGEKVRLALACLFSGKVVPQLLILDEPTNHLDIETVEMLETALADYDGAIILSTHDKWFQERLKIDRAIELKRALSD